MAVSEHLHVRFRKGVAHPGSVLSIVQTGSGGREGVGGGRAGGGHGADVMSAANKNMCTSPIVAISRRKPPSY